MQGFDGAAFVAVLNTQIAEAMKGALTDMHTRLLAHENALVAVIVALDKTGALPIAAAKSAIDAMAAGIAEGPLNAPQREVLKRLSESLARQQSPPTQRH